MKWVALVFLIANGIVRQPSPLVQTRSGLLRGAVSHNGRFLEYFGIPYATVNDSNRFQAPLPAPVWDGILNALNVNTWCPQSSVGSIVLGETNCLKLNIYKPIQYTKLLPVMVYIHGGCFFSGTGSPYLYGGDFFAEHDVILVSINYRLSVEGFLCLGIKEAPGNAGLKDVVAALKWIKNNIKSFNGDPNDVTLFGESAGAVITSLMVLTTAARSLFHKAIMQSGSTLAPWALQHDPIKTASALVKKLGYNTKDPKDIYNILRNKSTKELINTISNYEDKFCVAESDIFVPCVEKRLKGIESIITDYPSKIIMSGNYTKVPMIIGNTDKEGIYFVSADYGTSLKNNTIAIDPMRTLQRDLQFPSQLDKNCTADKITHHYFLPHNEEMIMNMVDLYSDVHFKFPIALESNLYSRTTNQPIYHYKFKYSGIINMAKMISGFGLTKGACHGDDLLYLFKPHSFPLPHRYLENKMIRRMVTMWTNFAKYSDPTPYTSRLLPYRWHPSRRQNPTALVIDSKITTAPMWDEDSVRLWNDTYNKYRRKDYGFK